MATADQNKPGFFLRKNSIPFDMPYRTHMTYKTYKTYKTYRPTKGHPCSFQPNLGVI